MPTLELTFLKTTEIDHVDFAWAKQWKWSASKNHRPMDRVQKYYACRSERTEGVQKRIYLHKAIMQRVLGRALKEGERVAHRDGDSLNNHRRNLFLLPPGEGVRRNLEEIKECELKPKHSQTKVKRSQRRSTSR